MYSLKVERYKHQNIFKVQQVKVLVIKLRQCVHYHKAIIMTDLHAG